ncbi:protein S-acyltransferase 11 isoform X2 [Cryptomeria japonica]|nr:protein S-acyltransferase 11 isoform X2 [Cryptomeria japonica]
MLEENYETICWGCGLRLLLPSYSPVYKCGWCGAITNDMVKQHTRHWFDCCHAFGNRFFVLIVVCIILSIICGGVWAVYPVVFSTISLSSVFHSISTFILASGTLASYFLAAFRPAGPPPIISWGNYEVVGKGGLDNYSLCQFCLKPKSEQTHHCSSCKTCVLNMDHHCPFIGNCVGATNHHHFITFLFFALVSNIYVLLMSIYAGILVWPTLAYVPIDPVFAVRSANVFNIIKAFLHALMRSSVVLSARAVALIYLIVASISVAVGIGLLFFQQVQLLYSGKTYIDSLKYRSNGAVEALPLSRGWGNLFRIFGSGHPIFWLLPKKFKSSPSSMKSH